MRPAPHVFCALHNPPAATNMPPPTGPRGATATSTRQTRSSTSASRTPRGGITRRGRPSGPRGDRDGDVDMDISAASKPSKSGGGIHKLSGSSTRRGTARSSGAPRSNTRLQQNLAKHLGGDTSHIPKAPSAARIAANNTTLIVLGLKSSKATSNPDGGVKSLLQFLERKATQLKGSGRPVTIKKVCQGIPPRDTGGKEASPKVHPRHSALNVAERVDNRIRLSPLLPFP